MMSNDEKLPGNIYELKNETVLGLVAHSISNITNDCGYQSSNQASLDILTDLCCDYIKKITTNLKFANETSDWRDSENDFVNSLERVFHQLNIPSAANLHQFICRIEAIRKYQLRQQEIEKQQLLKPSTTSTQSNSHHNEGTNDIVISNDVMTNM